LIATWEYDRKVVQPQRGCAKPNAAQTTGKEKPGATPINRGWKPVSIYSQVELAHKQSVVTPRNVRSFNPILTRRQLNNAVAVSGRIALGIFIVKGYKMQNRSTPRLGVHLKNSISGGQSTFKIPSV